MKQLLAIQNTKILHSGPCFLFCVLMLRIDHCFNYQLLMMRKWKRSTGGSRWTQTISTLSQCLLIIWQKGALIIQIVFWKFCPSSQIFIYQIIHPLNSSALMGMPEFPPPQPGIVLCLSSAEYLQLKTSLVGKRHYTVCPVSITLFKSYYEPSTENFIPILWIRKQRFKRG